MSAAEAITPTWPRADVNQIRRFLELLGKKKGSGRYRGFFPSGDPRKDGDKGRKGPGHQENPLEMLGEWQAEGRGAYVVINDGGDSKKEITACRALFCEWDDKPIEWQMDAWRELGLPEPTMQVSTGGKSIHCYWVLDKPISPAHWEPLQKELIAFVGGDPKCKDACRVMRLPGTWYMHPGTNPGELVQIVQASGLRYAAAEIKACLPEIKPPSQPRSPLQAERASTPGAVPLEELLPRDLEHLAREGVSEGSRNADCFALAASALAHGDAARAAGLLVDGTAEGLVLAFASRCSPPMPQAEALQCLMSAESEKREPDPGWSERLRYQLNKQAKSPTPPAQQAAAPADEILPSLEQSGTDPSRAEVQQRSYSELLSEMLLAVMAGHDDDAMAIRAEIIGRFKRSDSQVEAALFRLHTELEAGGKNSEPPESLDLSRISGMDWLVEGFIPDNDLTLIWGDAGSGKTTAALAAAYAVLSGRGFLDHSHPAGKGAVLFIASDSGAQPLRAAMQDMDMADLPEVQQGAGQRFFVWAADNDQGMTAWCADLRGCTRLLQFIRKRNIELVVIDSCKAACSGAGIDYTNNQTVTSLLTYFKEVICPHAAVVWLNHDGTAKGAAAGAKAWKEIPSMVHRIRKEEQGDGSTISNQRRWAVTKSRMGPCREFDYQLKDGFLELCPHQQVVGNCLAHVVEALSNAWTLQQKDSLYRTELIERICLAGGPSRSTLDNTLSTATKAKHPEICRAGRGRYKLAPRVLELLKGRIANGKEQAKTPFPDRDLSISRQVPIGKSGTSRDFPGKNDGKSVDPFSGNRSDPISSHRPCAPMENPVDGALDQWDAA